MRMDGADQCTSAGPGINILDHDNSRGWNSQDFIPPFGVLEVIMPIGSRRRAFDFHGDGIAGHWKQFTEKAMDRGVGVALVPEANPKTFDRIGDFARCQSVVSLEIFLRENG